VNRLRIDPHVHSEASYDGHEPVELLLEQAAEVGLDGLVVTDHDRIEASLRAAELAPDYGLVGLPGVEVSTADGHLLALGVRTLPPRGRPLSETVRWVHGHGGVAVVPHPFQRLRHGVSRRTLADCSPAPDAVETYNSWLVTGIRNRRARRFAERRGLPGVAASDAHRVGYVGRAYTEVDAEARTAESVLDAFRAGATRVRGQRTPVTVSARHYATGAARKSGYYARVGALQSAALARTGALRSATLARAGVVRTARTLYRVSPLS
jgi:predicted metal-dependent phosphoesterase TrpH